MIKRKAQRAPAALSLAALARAKTGIPLGGRNQGVEQVVYVEDIYLRGNRPSSRYADEMALAYAAMGRNCIDLHDPRNSCLDRFPGKTLTTVAAGMRIGRTNPIWRHVRDLIDELSWRSAKILP